MNLLRDLRAALAPTILVIAGLVSTLASFGDQSWAALSVSASAVAFISATAVIRNATLVPRRLRSAWACVGGVETAVGRKGSALRIREGLWITASALCADGSAPIFVHDDQGNRVRVLRSARDERLALLQLDRDTGDSVPCLGSPESWELVRCAGYVQPDRHDAFRPVRLSVDMTMQGGPRGTPELSAVGPVPPPRGFVGAPVISLRSVRVVGICIRTSTLSGNPRDPSDWSLVTVAEVSAHRVQELEKRLSPLLNHKAPAKPARTAAVTSEDDF